MASLKTYDPAVNRLYMCATQKLISRECGWVVTIWTNSMQCSVVIVRRFEFKWIRAFGATA